jgi:hypothetical protein
MCNDRLPPDGLFPYRVDQKIQHLEGRIPKTCFTDELTDRYAFKVFLRGISDLNAEISFLHQHRTTPIFEAADIIIRDNSA